MSSESLKYSWRFFSFFSSPLSPGSTPLRWGLQVLIRHEKSTTGKNTTSTLSGAILSGLYVRSELNPETHCPASLFFGVASTNCDFLGRSQVSSSCSTQGSGPLIVEAKWYNLNQSSDSLTLYWINFSLEAHGVILNSFCFITSVPDRWSMYARSVRHYHRQSNSLFSW